MHASALFSPHPHCRCQNDNTYSEGLHILKLYANGAYQPFVQIKPGTVINHLGINEQETLQNAKTMWTWWSLSLNIQYQDSDPLHVTFVINVINIPRQQFLTIVNLAHQITIKQILRWHLNRHLNVHNLGLIMHFTGIWFKSLKSHFFHVSL